MSDTDDHRRELLVQLSRAKRCSNEILDAPTHNLEAAVAHYKFVLRRETLRNRIRKLESQGIDVGALSWPSNEEEVMYMERKVYVAEQNLKFQQTAMEFGRAAGLVQDC